MSSPSTSSITLSNVGVSEAVTSQAATSLTGISMATTSSGESPSAGTFTCEPFPFEAHILETPLSEDIVNTSSSLQESSTDSDPLSTMEDPSVILNISASEESNVQFIEMPFSRVVATHGYCFVCGSKKGIINVPFETRKQVFIIRRLYVPKGNRCCPSHLLKKAVLPRYCCNLTGSF